MVTFIISIVVSLLPSILIYRWLLKVKDDEKFKKICKNAFMKGILSAFPILLTSFLFTLIGGILGVKKLHPLLYQAFHTFIVLALAEEYVKFKVFKKVLKKNTYDYSWYDVTLIMTIIGFGFQCIESVVYCFSSSIISMAIRGIDMGHAEYGYLMGWYYGKYLKTREKKYAIYSFVIPWFLHGLYDFSLCDELIEFNDNFVFLPFLLTFIGILFVIVIIWFVKKKKEDREFTRPLPKTQLV